MSSGLLSNQFIDTTSRDPFVPWTRPADWLDITSLEPTVGQQKIVMLCAVLPSDSMIAFTISGAYTIDWGDGTSTVNVATGVKTSKLLQWSSYSGSTLTSRGYRQAVVTITPQAGQQFTSLDFTVLHSSVSVVYTGPVLDMIVAGPNVSAMQIGTNQGNVQALRMMERFRYVGTNVIANPYSMFQGLVSLRTCAATNGQGYDLWLASAGNATSCFNSCFSLDACPVLYTTGSLTNTSQMFISCWGMRSVPLFNTSGVSIGSQMFNSCSALTSIPAFDWSSLSTAVWLFNGCAGLTSIPAANTPVLTAASGIFQNCSALTALPAWDYSKVTTFTSGANSCFSLTDVSALSSSTALGLSSLNIDMSSAFSNCRALKNLPPINTSGVVTMASCFYSATSIQTLPTPSGNNWKMASCVSMNRTFNGCLSLQAIPLLDTSSCTNFGNMFDGCSSLQLVPALNVAAGTTFVGMFNGCSSVQSAPLSGGRFAISFAGCLLNAAALDAIYTGLGTASGSQTVTVTGNPGTTGDTPSIATGKGWTVAGS